MRVHSAGRQGGSQVGGVSCASCGSVGGAVLARTAALREGQRRR